MKPKKSGFFSHLREHSFLSLDKKLLGVVLVVNVLFTLCWTFISVHMQQKTEIKNQSQDFQYIKAVILPAIENSVWNVDQEQTRVQVQGILVNPRVVRVQIFEKGGNGTPFIDISKGGTFSDVQTMFYDLKAPSYGEGKPFASMVMYTTLDPIMSRMWSETMRYVISEGLETLILSFLILYTVRVLVLNHLGHISKFFKENSYISKHTPHFYRKSQGRFNDEIDTLVTTINRTIDESKKYQSQVEDLKDRAEKANQAKSMFLASINHELRTPLNAILGVSDLLQDSTDPNETKQLLDIQKRSGLHLLHLVDEILDFSKIEAGQVKIESQPMDIRKALETCRMIMESHMKERENRLEMVVDPKFPALIFGDLNRINQIIINLVSNANKFTDRGVVTVQINAKGLTYEIMVKDTGRGIPEDKLEEIFLPFRQLDNQPNLSRKGTGIGLSITKRLVDIMGGHIDVDSKVGFGSAFLITLPLNVVMQQAQPPPPPPPATKQQIEDTNLKHRVKLLVVEDTPEVQMLIQAYLKGADVDLTFAQNGEEGVLKFEKDHPSVIFMDLQMPVMNGFEATQKIRELERKDGNHHVRIFALTALATKGDLDQALQAGCDGYVTKPFSKTKLLQTLQEDAGAAS